MRQITITAPQGSAIQVAEIAFAVGISEVTFGEKRILGPRGSEIVKDSIEMETGTPVAKASSMNSPVNLSYTVMAPIIPNQRRNHGESRRRFQQESWACDHMSTVRSLPVRYR